MTNKQVKLAQFFFTFEKNSMNQNFYAPEEFDHVLMGMNIHQRGDMLLCIDEILTAWI